MRYIGRFLPDDPLGVPWPVVEHLAEQLGIEDVSDVKRYTERLKPAYGRWRPQSVTSWLDSPGNWRQLIRRSHQ